MIIFESILTSFKVSIVFKAAWAIVEIGLILKPNHNHNQVWHVQILWNALYEKIETAIKMSILTIFKCFLNILVC